MSQKIEDALRLLRDHSADRKTPGDLEAKLAGAFRRHHASRRRTRIAAGLAAAASVAIAVVLLGGGGSTPVEAPPQTVAVWQSPVLPVKGAVSAIRSEPVARTKPVRKKRTSRLSPQRREAESFVELPYAPAFEEYDSGQVVRVNMRGASLRSLGLPVLTDNIQADLLVGDDGIARAVRLVSNSGLSHKK